MIGPLPRPFTSSRSIEDVKPKAKRQNRSSIILVDVAGQQHMSRTSAAFMFEWAEGSDMLTEGERAQWVNC
jgi:hypothetical protein